MERNDNAVLKDIHELFLQAKSNNALFQKANTLLQLGKLTEAKELSKEILDNNPNHIGAIQLLGVIASQSGQHQLAIKLFSQVVNANSQQPEFFVNYGRILHSGGQLEEALAAYKRAIQLDPKSVEAHNKLGYVYSVLCKYTDSINHYRMALSLKPDCVETYYNLGNVFRKQGKPEQSLDCYRKALSFEPDYGEARWAYTLTKIPAIIQPDHNYKLCRKELSRELSDLDCWFDTNRIESGHLCVGTHYPFYLAYQEKNNRDLLSQHGALCARLMGSWMAKQEFVRPDATVKSSIRIGIVSATIRSHSVWNAFVRSWFMHLDKKRYEIHVFHTDGLVDSETSWARSNAASFSQGPYSLHKWVEIIIETQCDVLIYPEIGMDAVTVKLASLRLANIQVASWGHPETTGLPTMDYYLSAENFETPNSQENYTEKLVLLPHLGCCYQHLPAEEETPDLKSLGIKTDNTIYICPGTPFKYSPRHDRVFVEIARRLGTCQFVFFIDEHCNRDLSNIFRQRLSNVFVQAGLDVSKFVIFIPWQERSAFMGLMKQADVYLDTIGFSGFNTASQAVECNLPIVTMEGDFLRGRLASGIMQRIGLQELIVYNDDEYIELAVRLSHNAEYRQLVQQKIIMNRHKMYNDLAPVLALDKFLTDVAKNIEP